MVMNLSSDLKLVFRSAFQANNPRESQRKSTSSQVGIHFMRDSKKYKQALNLKVVENFTAHKQFLV